MEAVVAGAMMLLAATLLLPPLVVMLRGVMPVAPLVVVAGKRPLYFGTDEYGLDEW